METYSEGFRLPFLWNMFHWFVHLRCKSSSVRVILVYQSVLVLKIQEVDKEQSKQAMSFYSTYFLYPLSSSLCQPFSSLLCSFVRWTRRCHDLLATCACRRTKDGVPAAVRSRLGAQVAHIAVVVVVVYQLDCGTGVRGMGACAGKGARTDRCSAQD